MLTQFFPDANAIFSHLIGGSIGNESLSPDVGRRRGSRRFDWVLLGFTGFYWVLRWKGRRSGRRLFQPDNYGEERIAPTIGRSEVTVSCRVFIGFCFFFVFTEFRKKLPSSASLLFLWPSSFPLSLVPFCWDDWSVLQSLAGDWPSAGQSVRESILGPRAQSGQCLWRTTIF